jgi:RimJ/RimL family protein N-acetyltransferase
MSEALEAIMKFSKTHMKVSTISAIVYIENNICKKLVEKFGFNIVGMEVNCMFRGKMYPHHIYERHLNKMR